MKKLSTLIALCAIASCTASLNDNAFQNAPLQNPRIEYTAAQDSAVVAEWNTALIELEQARINKKRDDAEAAVAWEASK